MSERHDRSGPVTEEETSEERGSVGSIDRGDVLRDSRFQDLFPEALSELEEVILGDVTQSYQNPGEGSIIETIKTRFQGSLSEVPDHWTDHRLPEVGD